MISNEKKIKEEIFYLSLHSSVEIKLDKRDNNITISYTLWKFSLKVDNQTIFQINECTNHTPSYVCEHK